VSPDDEVKVARRTAVVIGILAIIGGISPTARTSRSSWPWPSRSRRERQPADDPLLAVLEGLHHPGALWSMYGGLISSLVADHLQPGRLRQAGGRPPSSPTG
jgi:cation/acetate symporter